MSQRGETFVTVATFVPQLVAQMSTDNRFFFCTQGCKAKTRRDTGTAYLLQQFMGIGMLSPYLRRLISVRLISVQYGIRVNAVLPAEVLTPQYESWVGKQSNPQARLKHISGQIPLENRMTTAAETAAAVVFLLSPTQSGHTTAQFVIVDGGYVHLDRMLTAKG